MTEGLRVEEFSSQSLADLCQREPVIGMKLYRSVAEILGGRYRATLTRLTGTLDSSLQEMLRQPDIFANI